MTDRSTGGPIGRLTAPFVGPNTIGNRWPFGVAFVVAVVAMGLYPLLIGPFAAGRFALFFAYAFLGLSLALVWGYGGILSFGQVAFFGIAGYTFGIVTLNVASPLGITAAVVAAVVAGSLAAFLLGYFMFYGGVTDVYVTIITLVTVLVLHTFMAQTAGSEWTIGEAALGGFNGMPGIPQLALGVEGASLRFVGSWFYWLLFGLLVATYLGLRAFVNSDFGRVAVAIREDEDRTRMFGYDVKRVKLILFTLGGAIASLGGVLYTTWGNYIDPSVFSLAFATLPVIWVSVGGRESLLGAVVGSVTISRLNEWLSANVPEFALIVMGTLLVTVILFLPDGVIPGLDAIYRYVRGSPDATPAGPEGRPEVSD